MFIDFFNRKRPFLIAEIGGNHEGDFEYAKELCRLAASTDVDCVKFQIYKGESIVNKDISPDRYKHFTKFELSREQHVELAEMCKKAGKIYSASIWDVDMIDWVDDYLEFYKIGSGDLTARPFTRFFARKGKPIIISTGLSNIDEVKDAVVDIQHENPVYNQPGMLSVLQCTSMYPIPDKDANISVMLSLQKEIPGIQVGYSDHTEGLEALVLASALGAKVLEFHFTDTREGKSFRDHKVSLTPSEIPELIRRIDNALELVGEKEKKPLDIEIETGHVTSFRRGIYPVADLKAGTVVAIDSFVFLRPASGISAADIDKLVGKKLLSDVKALQVLDFSMFK